MPARRRLTAAIPLTALLACYGTFLATSNMISNQAMAAITLMLSGAIVLLLADDRDPPVTGWLTVALAVPATVCAALALEVEPGVLLSIAVSATLTLWVIQLAEHLTFEVPDDRGSGLGGPVAPARLAPESPMRTTSHTAAPATRTATTVSAAVTALDAGARSVRSVLGEFLEVTGRAAGGAGRPVP